ncbi:hypothetical protein OJ996_21760 [Luteolibacter sp. GHJ8]|uniref:Type II toxin-antitoxin system prevent-host-death family antitoxin n=1 Tax=Luteolibacter rhizosphaerae TaxID=2989719 RepID=A0ABT3G9B8_9BACT|nr:hypothetical protein [Luteolibacter rhizosphaerae]MCW1916232.1 hypothetical protein [Luteolibacter rhizosphaerae]
MKATSVDLRYRTKEVLAALDRRETVSLHVRGKLRGYIVPAEKGKSTVKAADHPFFGSRADDKEDVSKLMDRLRAPRHHDI